MSHPHTVEQELLLRNEDKPKIGRCIEKFLSDLAQRNLNFDLWNSQLSDPLFNGLVALEIHIGISQQRIEIISKKREQLEYFKDCNKN